MDVAEGTQRGKVQGEVCVATVEVEEARIERLH